MARHLLWTRRDRPGLEHLRFRSNRDRGGGVRAQGTVVGLADGAPVGATYEYRCDREWRVRAADLTVRGPGAGRASLSTDDPGEWTDLRDDPMPELDGCLDAAVGGMAFPHTLALSRLGLDAGESAEVRVARLRLPDAGVDPMRRRYARLDADTYRVANLPDGGGDAGNESESAGATEFEFRVDADGFVTESPVFELTATATDD